MKILVIDDDPAVTDLLSMMLDSIGAVILKANSGAEGLRILQESNPALVIQDLIMPEMDGWELTQNIRKVSSVPILILSVIDNPGLVAKALDVGADDFLSKPASSGILIAHINNLLRRGTCIKEEEPSTQINVHTLA